MKTLFKPLAVLLALTLSSSAWSEQRHESDTKQPASSERSTRDSVYIVQLKGRPVLGYEGEVSGYKATKPARGDRINRKDPDVEKYAGYLDRQHDLVLGSVGAGKKMYSYRYAMNGFAAVMTPEQAETLRASGKVQNVWKDELLQLQTDNSPNYINITRGGEAWSKGYVGENVVIGVVDSGVWPESASIADVRTPKKGNKGKRIPYGAPPASWSGTGCEFGNDAFNPADAPFDCNNKLLSAKAFGDAFKSVYTLLPEEFDSARDSNGHGTHTLTTAGGNYGVRAGDSKISGIAPRARVAAYKSCWSGIPLSATDTGAGCFGSDSAAAIDEAVADGVDVINFSVGGSSTNFDSPDSVAFLFAADAGVFVATSNGNAGPGAGTVGTPSGVPWITAVGATQDNVVFGLVIPVTSPASVAGDKEALEGAGPVQLADTGPISGDVVLTAPADGCGPLAEDLTGKIALSVRGTCGFITKYDNAAAAGATAIIVFNDGANSTRIDPIVMGGLDGATIPGAMIGFYDGIAMAGEAGVVAILDPSALVSRENRIAGFSSRGPNRGALDIIKPDLSAPGVSILAGVSGGGFANLSGTSMASPHVAGAFALLKQAHPDWTAAMARSALMTTARQDLKKTFGDAAADPFDIGAGEIQPSDAFDPGLVYDAGLFEYAAFSCENNYQIFSDGSCAFLKGLGIPSDGSDLNLPSIGIGELAGAQTVTRTVTSVTRDKGSKSFTVSVDAPPGINVSVNPSTIKLKAGETASYQVTFTATDAAVLRQWAFGSLTWKLGEKHEDHKKGKSSRHKNDGHDYGDRDDDDDYGDRDDDDDGKYAVRSPIAIYPVAFSAPDNVAGSGTDGSLSYDVSFGYSGDFVAGMDGLAEGTVWRSAVPDFEYTGAAFYVPAGQTLARFSLFDEDVGAGNGTDDVDLQVYYLGENFELFTFVGSSGSPTSAEEVNIVNPAGGYYAAYVFDYATGAGDTVFALFNFNLDGSDAGNATVTAPASATVGTTGQVQVDWAALTGGTRYLGKIGYNDGVDSLGVTEVMINTQ